MSFTLTTLKQSIQDWTENDETTFVNELDFIIKNAEERILKSVDLDFFRKNVTGGFTTGNKFLQKPTDYLASFSLSFVKDSENVFLLQKDVNFIQEFHPNPSTTGSPRFYSSFDIDNFIVAPTPDADYVAELHYYYRPTSLTTDDSGTTWISTNAPDALLYACLIEAYSFMKGESDILQLYTARYGEAITRLKVYGEAQENTDAYREGLVKIPKQ
tara:strand:+ start:1268 stop:1912 length:645 start_codon:yes stop_codon:yes gene_type:complete